MSKKGTFVVWEPKKTEGAVVLDRLENVERPFEFRKGISRSGDFPSNALFTQNTEFSDNSIWTDSLINTLALIVGSNRLKEFLQKRKTAKVEYLPVKIIDKNGNVASWDYHIIHPVHPIDCIEIEKSGGRWGRVARDSIKSLERLVIDESKTDPYRDLFRLRYFYNTILVRKNLADEIEAAGFTGIRWVNVDDYPDK